MGKKPKSSDIHSGPGFRVRTSIERPDQSLIDGLGEFETPDISDVLNRLYAMSTNITNYVNDVRIAGPAVTVKVYAGDNLMVHKAIDLVTPGDIIVVDAGTSKNAVIGDLVAAKAKHRGVAGFVIDGYVRDIPAMRKVGLPVFATGVTPVGPLHRGPGEINYPISCGGIVVEPGDIVVADETGVVSVRKDFAVDTLKRVREMCSGNADYVAEIQKGNFSLEWADRVLEAAGCKFDEGVQPEQKLAVVAALEKRAA